MTQQSVVKLATLRELASAGTVRSVSVIGQKGGYAVNVRYGMSERTLADKTGDIRVFASIDSAAKTLRDLGIASFDVDAMNYEEGRLRGPRPDLAERMREKHRAARHDAWFREQVETSLAKPSPQFVSHEDATAHLVGYAREKAAAKKVAAKPTAARKPAAKKATR